MTEPKTPVLVVEDEIFIRMVAVDTLAERGYSTLEAGDAADAIALIERTPGIALIFTDINMPGDKDGLDLAAEVAMRWPEIEIIVTSGARRLSDDQIPDHGHFLSKPYSAAALSELVGEKLAKRAG